MKKLTRTLAIFGIAAVLAGGEVLNAFQTSPAQKHDVKDSNSQAQTFSPEELAKLSEAFGHFFGRNLTMPGIKFDVESVIKGLRNGFEGKPAPMSDTKFEEEMLKLQKIAFARISDDNLKKANEFLSQNSKQPNIVEIEPGKLQYLILEQGSGKTVETDSNPQINYTGKYIDGTVFGSSVDAGGPITIPLNQTIPGFSKGIVGMKEGEKRRLFVHPDLGYGTMGQLPPNSLLIFDIEVVKASSPKTSEKEDDDLLPLAMDDEDALDDLDDDDDDLDDEDTKHSSSDKSAEKKA